MGSNRETNPQHSLDANRSEAYMRPGFGGSEPEHGRIPDSHDERLGKAIHDIESGYDPSVRFETQLMLEGLLDRLEQAGIVPIAENPNPCDPDVHEDEHERWWVEHPQEADEFERDVDRRNEILRCLYIGAVIGSGPWNLP
jgi:hypothetical protein